MRNLIKLQTITFITLVALGLFLRIYRLSEIPMGFFGDEASIGYNAYTILTNGTDEYGVFYPIFFKAFGEYKSPIQIYSTVPLVAIFGLNEFSVRLVSTIYGTLSIISIYFLVKELFRKYEYNRFLAIISALFLSISPWHIHFSRVSLELMPHVFFTIMGIYFFLKAQDKPLLLSISLVTFGLSIYSYFPARIFVPLFGLGISLIYFRFFSTHKKLVLLNLILLILLLIPLFVHTFSPYGLTPWQQVSIFSNPPKEEAILTHVVNNYFSHFSFDFLLLKGDIDMPGQFITRHSVRDIGELYLFQLPLLILGLYFCYRIRQKRILALLILWLLLYPIGSMFTVEKSAQATRSIIGVIPFQILSACGLVYVINLLSKTRRLIYFLSITAISVIMVFSFSKFINLYFLKYPLYSSDYWGWQYGYRNIMIYFKQVEYNFDELLITHRFNGPSALLKFYNVNYNCHRCQVMSNPIKVNVLKKQLFALRKDDINQAKELYPELKFNIIKTIHLPNGTPEFFIGNFITT